MMIFITTLNRITLLLFSIFIVCFVYESGQVLKSDLAEGFRIIYPQFVNIGLRSKREGAIKNG